MRDLTDVTVILDRSGSMSTMHGGVVEGLNDFIEKQRRVPGEAVFSLVQFDADVDDWYDKKHDCQHFNNVSLWKMDDFIPRGMTALHDAIGRTITDTGIRLSKMSEYQRPNKVVIFVISDGHENSSRKYNKQRINDMIKHQQDVYNWEFVFLGTNQDSFKTSGDYGMSHHNTKNYVPTSRGVKGAVHTMSAGLTALRASAPGANKLNFFNNELALKSGSTTEACIPEADEDKKKVMSEAEDPIATLKKLIGKKTHTNV